MDDPTLDVHPVWATEHYLTRVGARAATINPGMGVGPAATRSEQTGAR